MRASPSRSSRAAILAACRRFMQAGRLRPSMRACAARAGWSTSTGHRCFGPVAALHRAAIDDIATHHAIVRRILGTERRGAGAAPGLRTARRIVRTAVLGRV